MSSTCSCRRGSIGVSVSHVNVDPSVAPLFYKLTIANGGASSPAARLMRVLRLGVVLAMVACSQTDHVNQQSRMSECEHFVIVTNYFIGST